MDWEEAGNQKNSETDDEPEEMNEVRLNFVAMLDLRDKVGGGDIEEVTGGERDKESNFDVFSNGVDEETAQKKGK